MTLCEIDLVIRAYEVKRARDADYEAMWVRWNTMPHMKRPFQMDTLRPGRELQGEVVKSSVELKARLRAAKRAKVHKTYLEGRNRAARPVKSELEMLKGK